MKNIVKVLLTTLAAFAVMTFITQKPDGQDIIKDTARHVVKLESLTGSGTGFYVVYKGKNYLVTNKHVCDNDIGLSINGRFKLVKAVSTVHDLCILESRRTSGLRLAVESLEQFDKVYVVGHPKGNKLTAREGKFVAELSNVFSWVKPYPIDYLHVSIVAFGGNSGSPVLNEYGRVIGVLFSGDPRTNEDAHLVPVRVLRDFIEQQR